ncbi:MAG: hypothetical protein Q8O33_11290, partial [Pseudomonadota bacterium]|nr:hypothetical protein [Pseudomonadota bacterium]
MYPNRGDLGRRLTSLESAINQAKADYERENARYLRAEPAQSVAISLDVLQAAVRDHWSRGVQLLKEDWEAAPNGYADFVETLITCCIPCDYVPVRSWPLFRARDLMQQLIESFTPSG